MAVKSSITSKRSRSSDHHRLDDFGTGTNNIEIISVISPPTWKLDRCFVKDIESGNINKVYY
ncbi:hypothetical protein OK016_19905 [Vibrio chagasii]|nr:hypothetical protein [Vibrio chagasii]